MCCVPESISNRALTLRLFAFAVGMFAFGFLVLPPLYEVFCAITGFGGRTNSTAVAVRMLRTLAARVASGPPRHRLAEDDL